MKWQELGQGRAGKVKDSYSQDPHKKSLASAMTKLVKEEGPTAAVTGRMSRRAQSRVNMQDNIHVYIYHMSINVYIIYLSMHMQIDRQITKRHVRVGVEFVEQFLVCNSPRNQ